MTDDSKKSNNNSENNSDEDLRQKTFFISEVTEAKLVSQLKGLMVGNVVKSFMGGFISAEKLAQMLKNAGFIVKIAGGKFASRISSDKNKPRSR